MIGSDDVSEEKSFIKLNVASLFCSFFPSKRSRSKHFLSVFQAVERRRKPPFLLNKNERTKAHPKMYDVTFRCEKQNIHVRHCFSVWEAHHELVRRAKKIIIQTGTFERFAVKKFRKGSPEKSTYLLGFKADYLL